MKDDMELKRALDALPREVEPPADAWPGIRAKIAQRRAEPRRRGFNWPEIFEPQTIRIAAGIAAIGLGLAYVGASARAASRWVYNAWSATTGPAVAAGTPLVMTAIDRPLSAGAALRTEAHGWAQIRVGHFGYVSVWPNSDVRLVRARPVEQRMTLERGGISARIDAPPRLFVVQTPTGVVTDMGCAYDLVVDSLGGSTLRVRLGWVVLENHGRESLVPQGFAVTTHPGHAVGTPIHYRALPELRAAIRAWDNDRSDTSAAAAAIRSATDKDAVTLWHMLPWVNRPQREAIYDRLAAIAAPPAGVTRDGVVNDLNRIMLRLWWEQLPGTLKIDTGLATRLWTLWLKVASWL